LGVGTNKFGGGCLAPGPVDVPVLQFVEMHSCSQTQRIRGYFYNETRYINLRFTYLLTYLVLTCLSTTLSCLHTEKYTRPKKITIK